MKSQKLKQYDSPRHFEPLLPAEAHMGRLLERASDLTRAASALGGHVIPATTQALRHLLRSMNSYYTQRIEGEPMCPSDIEKALHDDFSAEPDLARRQRVAVAHNRTEQLCEESLSATASTELALKHLYSETALTWLHRELFGSLAASDLKLGDGSLMVAGEFRSCGVAVGRHEAPHPSALPAFIARW